jgi:hypothetical protein
VTEFHPAQVLSCLELSSGDYIEARYQGRLTHRGRVAEVATTQEVFWIVDDLVGGRRLLDLSDVEIVKKSVMSSGCS